MPDLHPTIDRDIRRVHSELAAAGDLLSVEALTRYYDTFRRRFGPEVLRALEGEVLLERMHGNGRDGLIYWLEFKNDDEFPANFGSIAGGSALKYGLYRRAETGAWTTGTPLDQREIPVQEAVGIANNHRAQLLAASELLGNLPVGSDDAAYAALQRGLVDVAPDIEDSSWGHKYLSLLHPDKLDDFHAASYQRINLIKLLERPAEGEGRYLNAAKFLTLGAQLGWPINHVTTVLNRRHGPAHRYWRIGTRSGDDEVSHWEMMRRRSVVAIGWRWLGDLNTTFAASDGKEQIRNALTARQSKDPRAIGRAAQQIVHFGKTIQAGDYVVASDGAQILGIGRVAGPYQYDDSEAFPHMRPVEWLDIGEWRFAEPEGLRTTVHQLKRYETLIAIERRLIESADNVRSDPPHVGDKVTPTVRPPGQVPWTRGGMIGRIQDVLSRKGQVILYGPPGTGKTHWAEQSARELAALWNFGISPSELNEQQRVRLSPDRQDSFVQFCCFHPGYGYEDFIEGYQPALAGGAVHFQLRSGIFKHLCDTAATDPNHRYFLIVDEINRGDIPRIFGELITLLEKSKRGKPVTLPLSKTSFSVPPNVSILGTMNTADRSIALLDTALRRRFGFVELMPDSSVLGNSVVGGIAIAAWLAALNRRVAGHAGKNGRNLQIGHSYFLHEGVPVQDFSVFSRILQEDILPLLEEYCYDDWEALGRILEGGLVDVAQARFRSELFMPERRDDLVRAILAVSPEVSASRAAAGAESTQELDAAEAEEDDEKGED
jgi:5-methylcytosine-specific restriction enzyme B